MSRYPYVKEYWKAREREERRERQDYLERQAVDKWSYGDEAAMLRALDWAFDVTAPGAVATSDDKVIAGYILGYAESVTAPEA